MARIRRAKIRNLPLNPRVGILALHMRTHRRDQGADGPDAAFRRLKVEAKLIGERHGIRGV
jgi:hypothetical protein